MECNVYGQTILDERWKAWVQQSDFLQALSTLPMPRYTCSHKIRTFLSRVAITSSNAWHASGLSWECMKSFMQTQVLMYDHIATGTVQRMTDHVCAILCEIRCLDWPRLWISQALRSMLGHRRSSLVRTCRLMGSTLKFCDAVM